MKKLLALLLPIQVFAQNPELWKLQIKSPGGLIPAHILIEGDKAYAINADEKLEFDHVSKVKDTLHLKLELYDMELIFHPASKQGFFSKKGADQSFRQAAFTAIPNEKIRFKGKPATQKLSKRYQVTFTNPETGKESAAIGVFETQNNEVKGSFLTSTGDHRYLQGNVIGDSLFLSTMGNSATLYKVRIKGDSLVGGTSFNPFGRGNNFSGVASETYQLPDADKLTFLKEGYEKFDFTFKDIQGKSVSLSDPRFKGKITVVQILGTWCPNCLDETKFLLEYKAKHPDIEVIGLAFERSSDPASAHPKIARFIERFKVDYPVLFAGSTAEAGDKLPQLNHVMAFPTSIVVDKKGQVRKIHTGFSGPGTGKYYEEYVKEFSAFVDQLRRE
ncbi:TlpA family protein disulfide reductase [Leadbetterella byssophila]|uniref:TlpA family protein disulfide reductase n=1 Tax=Leadbetterella byssophila TaxID=316068 RepID=UPI00399EFFCB